ncbi:MAG TPA: hypothetical protein VKE96_03570 [Vicinamibacterales bacterium]|nr:hypothetical protein [Vicinamibacterales bacterium]
MATIPVDLTVENLQMYLGTIQAILKQELGRMPDFENKNDSIGAVLLSMALTGKTGADMLAFVQQTAEWHARHDPKPQPTPTPITPSGGGTVTGPEIRGRLRVDGPRLFDNVGPWRWKIVTAFDAQRLMIRGETAQLAKYADWTRSVGGNGWRVFLNWKVSGLDFRQVPTYFDDLRHLCEFTAAQRLRLLGTAICDQIPDGLSAQQDFLGRAFSVLADFDHTIGECANEPYNGNSELPTKFTSTWPSKLLVARGMCRPNAAPNPQDPHSTPYIPSLGFTTYQNSRDPDWFRKVGKDGFEIRGGFEGFAGSHDACVNNEPMGAAEAMQPGRRSNRPVEFKAAGGGAGLFTSGVTGHGDSNTMQSCVVPGPVESSCIQALFDSLEMVPIDAPTWSYTRYGPAHPNVPMPVALDPRDSDETSRMHAMVGPTQAAAVNYNSAFSGREDWQAVPTPGWRIVRQDGPVVLCERG